MSETTTSGDRGVKATSDIVGEMMASTELSVNAPDVAEPVRAGAIVGRSPGQLAWMRLRRDRVAVASAGVLGFTVLVVLAAPLIEWLYGDDPERGHSELLNSIGYPIGVAGGASGDHWLGITPQRGYDLFLQLIFGARTSLGIAVTASVLAVSLGVVVGVLAGYVGGWIDRMVVWFTDFMLAFPFFLFAIALVPSLSSRLADSFGEVAVWKRIAVIIALFTVFGWMTTARIVRGQVISLREREYVEAARCLGAGNVRIALRHVLPNILPPVIVYATLETGRVVIFAAGLSFLGLGVQPPTADWGTMLSAGRQVLAVAPHVATVPGILIFIVTLGFNLFGDGLRDALDPRLRNT